MANVKISALPAATVVGPTDLIPVVQSSTAKKATVSLLLAIIYPVGSIYISTLAANPNTLLGFGTWVAFGAGRVMVGLGAAPFNTLEATGGEQNHTLTIPEMPIHHHVQAFTTNPTVGSEGSMGSDGPSDEGFVGDTQDTGGGQAHNNLQPYIVVNAWKRTA
jgi:hypothetical protein